VELERRLINYSEFATDTHGRTPGPVAAAEVLLELEQLDVEQVAQIARLSRLRNKIVHGEVSAKDAITDSVQETLQSLLSWLKKHDPQGR
jgi:hypothetical protein